MASINLRPWREELRQEKQKEYISTLMLVAIVAGAIWWFVSGAYGSAIQAQEARNSYLTTQSKALDVKIKEIRELRSKKDMLLDRMQLIQDLQGNRPVVVRVFDELARVMPEELFIKQIKAVGREFSIEGRASSNDQVSTLMRNFDKSAWFENPNLSDVKANKGRYNSFSMRVTQTRPKSDEVK
jgi:type IV pilus assembly protein PilN